MGGPHKLVLSPHKAVVDMFASVLVKFVGKLCNLLKLSPSLLLLRRLVLLGVGDKQLVHISCRSLCEKNLGNYIVFHIPGFLLLLLLFLLCL
jgi:hypothetical protein